MIDIEKIDNGEKILITFGKSNIELLLMGVKGEKSSYKILSYHVEVDDIKKLTGRTVRKGF